VSTTPRVLEGLLVNLAPAQLNMNLIACVPYAQPRLKRGQLGAPVSVTVPIRGKVSIPDLLDCTREEALRVIEGSPDVQKFVKKGILKVV
jgi:hypothetical protein